MSTKSQKYKTVILQLLKELGGSVRGKKKLAKLLYFVDFDSYELYEKSVTNDVYYARDMGPLGASLQERLSEMEEENLITVRKEKTSGNRGFEPTVVYKVKAGADISLLSKNEIKIIRRVAQKYGRLTGKQLEDISHSEAPYVGTERHQQIPYELSLYRGTEFTD
ncbi:MAG: Panacea domain-containing protein [bacterium]